jgi:long-chain acyl-CoA synthetase
LREYSIPALAEIPASANAADVVPRRAAEQPSAVMLRRKAADGTWSDVTAAQFNEEVRALAKGFIAAGVEAGDRIAIMSHTRYEWTLIDYALWTAGAVVVPIYETSSAEQAEWILANSEARAVIAETGQFAAMISDARDRLPALEHLWLLDSDLPALTAGGADIASAALDTRAGSRGAADIATIIYTSGTTGRPKGCELTHENLLAAVRNAFLGPLASIHADGTASTLLFLPLAHVFARVIEVGTIEAGIVLGHCQDMNDLLPDLSSFQPTFVLAVPRVFEKVYNGAEAKATAEGKGKIFARAASAAVAYSESLDSSGPGLRLRAEHAHGKSIFPAYWHDEAATKDAFTADGYYATGDIGELDDEGFLTITGRKKEMIVTAGGKNVAPAVLEDRIRMHAIISQCMVVGDGRPFVGVLVTIDPEAFGPWKARHGKPADATVADLRDDPDLNAEVQAAVDDANKAVSRAESVRKFRILDGDFTQEQGHLSAKLGIKRAVLAKEFAAEIEALYS